MAPPYGKSDISNQLIRDSYQYVVQSDTVTGVMYRINGDFLVNPIFASGLTIYTGFTFIDGNQESGYVLTSDGSGNASWAPASAATPSSGVTSITVGEGLSANSTTGAVKIVFTGSSSTSGAYLPLSGGTVTGNTIFNSGLTANTLNVTGNTLLSGLTATTISATTYLNYPDTFVTGFTLTANTITLTQNRTDGYSSFTISLSAYTGSSVTSGEYLPLSGGTVTGNTIFQSGLTANTLNVTGNTLLSGLTATTISATTYLNYPDTFVTGFTLSSNTITLTQNRLDQYSAFTISLSAYTGTSISGLYLPLSGGTVTGGTIFQSGLTANTLTVTGNTLLSDLTATTISATTYYNLPLPFLRNETNSGATDTITINQSIFNPSDLTVLSTSVFIVDTNADYYVLGDLYNNGSIIVNGTLKIGGVLYNYGTITGSGIIE
jgi:hypothetical protein